MKKGHGKRGCSHGLLKDTAGFAASYIGKLMLRAENSPLYFLYFMIHSDAIASFDRFVFLICSSLAIGVSNNDKSNEGVSFSFVQ